jgi:hypothetical protein
MSTEILDRLHKIAMFFEDNGNEQIAEELHNVFVKLSAKKKKSKKKGNKPNDPALYSRCKAEIKRKFSVYPSAYANMSLVKLYKSRGGTYSSK